VSREALKSEIKLLVKIVAHALEEKADDLFEKYVYVDFADYGIVVNRIEYINRCEIILVPKSEHDCDLIRFQGVVSILGSQKFTFPYHKYGLDLVQEIKLYYKLVKACKRINNIKAFL
jgi:hypothetical protein